MAAAVASVTSVNKCHYCDKETTKEEEVVRLKCGHTVHIACIPCHAPPVDPSNLDEWLGLMAQPPMSVSADALRHIAQRIRAWSTAVPVLYLSTEQVHTIKPVPKH